MNSIEHRAYKAAFGMGPAIPKVEQDDYAVQVADAWQDIKSRKASLLTRPWLWLVMPFVQTRSISAPKTEPHAGLTNMLGFPSYWYKEFRGRIYLLKPMPSPGFPGS